MNSGERLKILRKTFGLNQSDFGEKIGLKQAAIGLLENSDRKITERTLMLLEEKYNVNRDWLLTGEGEMFAEVLPEDEFAKATGHLALDEDEALIRNIIVLYDKLDKPSRKVINDLIVEAVEKMKGGE